MKRKSSFVIFTFLAVFLFFGLGSWQLQRKTEKETLITALEQGLKKTPQDVDTVTSFSQFQPLIAMGKLLFGKTLFLTSKTYKGKNGFYVLDVFQTQGGKFLLVQRGWSSTRSLSTPLDTIKIEGIGRLPSPPTYFQPKNTPPTYFWIDLQAISKELKIPLLPYYLVANTSDNPHILPTPPLPFLPNNHLQYAITWYSLAFSLIVMLWYGRKKALKKD